MSLQLQSEAPAADVIDEFAASYFEYNGISPERRVEQVKVLRAFASSVAPRDVKDATAVDLARFCEQLLTERAPSTVRKQLNMIRPFFKWMWGRKYIDAERLMEVREVRPPRGAGKPRPKPYTRVEIDGLWAQMDEWYPWCDRPRKGEDPADSALYYLARWQRGSSPWVRVQAYAKRMQLEAIVSLALDGGLRLSECYHVSLDDVDPLNDYVVVHGARKNRAGESRTRAVPWTTPQMRTAVERWLELRKIIEPDHDQVWLSLHHAHFRKPMRYRRFEVLMTELGFEFHRLRHTCATELLRAGMKLEKVQRVLGHARIEQTLAYAQLLEGDIVKEAAKVEADFSRALRRAA